MIHRAGSDRVRRRFEKQTRENMDLKMHIKRRKMAENERREAGLAAEQGRAVGAQRPRGCGGRKGSRARAVGRLHTEKDELIAIPAP